MTYAQEMLNKGRAEGQQRSKVEIVEGLLRVGVAWDVIEAATGITEATFQGTQGAGGKLRFIGPAATARPSSPHQHTSGRYTHETA